MVRDDWVSFVTYLSGYLCLIVSEVSNSANGRSYMLKQMILDHGSANVLCLSDDALNYCTLDID